MKIGTTEKLKFKNLQRRLSLPLWQAVGLLECIWKVAYRNAPAGDIGRLPNEEIAAAIEWGGDADELIDALVATRWFDADETHRLLIHDWETECERWLRGSFHSAGKEFAKPTQCHTNSCTKPPTEPRPQEPTQHGTKDGAPSLTLPSLNLPSPPIPLSVEALELDDALPADWEGVVDELILEKVGLARQAARSAITGKCLANEALEVIRQYRELKPLFGPGMLKSKIENLQPSARINWPGNPKVSHPSTRADLERSQKKTACLSRTAARVRADNKLERDTREMAFGPILDAMPCDECTALIEKLKLSGAPDGLRRDQLLLELERQATA